MMFSVSCKSVLLAIAAIALVAKLASADRDAKRKGDPKSGSSNTPAVSDGSVAEAMESAEPKVLQRLRICNAYAWPVALDVHHVRALQKITGDEPLNYKDCRDFSLPLLDGDELDFKAGELDVGTFYAKSLPSFSATLLLIPRHADEHSGAVAFESHAFVDVDSPQMAVVDAYRGKEMGSVRIADPTTGAHRDMSQAEELSYNSVLAFSPGKYQIALVGPKGDSVPPRMIDMPSQAKYVVMRVGGSSAKVVNEHNQEETVHYPEEMVVYPTSEIGGSSTATLSEIGSAAYSKMRSLLAIFI